LAFACSALGGIDSKVMDYVTETLLPGWIKLPVPESPDHERYFNPGTREVRSASNRPGGFFFEDDEDFFEKLFQAYFLLMIRKFKRKNLDMYPDTPRDVKYPDGATAFVYNMIIEPFGSIRATKQVHGLTDRKEGVLVDASILSKFASDDVAAKMQLFMKAFWNKKRGKLIPLTRAS